MMGSVFVSYASADQQMADKVVAEIERCGIRCWISSRDIPPGDDYQGSIVRAIEAAEAVLLLYSQHANESQEMPKELGLASRFRKTIVPARLQDIVPSGPFAYQMTTAQFIDLFRDFESKIDDLCGRLAELFQTSAQIRERIERERRRRKIRRQIKRFSAMVAMLLVFAVTGWALGPRLAGWFAGEQNPTGPIRQSPVPSSKPPSDGGENQAEQEPKTAEQLYAKGKEALRLGDMNSAEQLFGQAIQFDPSLKSRVAVDFAEAASSALKLSDFDSAERYAQEAASYDPATAQKQVQAMFDKMAPSLCDLHALGKQRFMAMMNLFGNLGLPDAARETVPYRFAYGLMLYENGPRPQGIDILRDIARDSPKSCEGAEANYLLSPPPSGRIMVTGMQPVTLGNNELTAQLLYVDVFANYLRLTFSLRAGDNPQTVPYEKAGPRADQNRLLYILDDNGTKLNTTTGWVGGRQASNQVWLAAGEQAEVHADFPLPTAGSNTFKFVSPVWWNGWTWPETKIKRDLFE